MLVMSTAAHAAKSHKLIRIQLIASLGGWCACCGERELDFLEIDHINGGGQMHGNGARARYYKMWAEVREGRTQNLQILCANCHRSKTRSGICMHKKP